LRKEKYDETLSVLPGRGVYTLVVFLSETLDLTIGELGSHKLPKGYYTYTGSAVGPSDRSLRFRVDRHLRKAKKKRWHIDYLLADEKVRVTAVMAVSTTEKELECKVNRLITENMEGKTVVNGFGASDCRSNCGSHLLYLGTKEDVDFRVAKLYEEKFGDKSTALMFT